jgi:hypothetical protein
MFTKIVNLGYNLIKYSKPNMKYMNRVSVCLIVVAMCVTSALKAQDDLDKLLQGGVKDAQLLMEGYLDPAMKSISLGINQGWYNTAATHKLPGADLTFTTSAMYIPTSDLTYHVDNAKLTSIQLMPGSGRVPTLFGAETAPTYQIKATGTNFSGPPGIDLKNKIKGNFVPVPIANLGIGLPLHTDLKIRYVPTLDLGSSGTFNLFGIGIMHDVKQYIPGLKMIPIDISAFIGYTKLKLDADLSGSYQGTGQRAVFEMNATTIQALVSKKISVVTFYGGLGYNIAKSKIAMKGSYDFNYDGDNGSDPGEKDPIALNFGAGGPRVTTGMRLKLAVFTFHADYTVQKYNALTVGFGICVR